MKLSVRLSVTVALLAVTHLSLAEWSGPPEEEKKFCSSLCAEKCGCRAFDCGSECLCECQHKKDDRYISCLEGGKLDPRLKGMNYDIVVQGPQGHNRIIRGAPGQAPHFPGFGKIFGGLPGPNFGQGRAAVAQGESVASGNPSENVAAPQDESVAAPQDESVAAPQDESVQLVSLGGLGSFNGLLPGAGAKAAAAGAPAAFPAIPGFGKLDDLADLNFKSLGALIPAAPAPAPAPVPVPAVPSFKSLGSLGLGGAGGAGGFGGLGNLASWKLGALGVK